MRQIKFRAWADDEMDYLDDDLTWFDATPDWKSFAKLMQFTGLLDKEEKEIYEGDLLQAPPNGNEPRLIYQVYWGHAHYRMKSIDGSDNFPLHEADLPYRIVGNIYENPKLLQKEAA